MAALMRSTNGASSEEADGSGNFFCGAGGGEGSSDKGAAEGADVVYYFLL